MSSKFCLVPKLVDKFKQAIRSGELNIEKLSVASSEERRKFFQAMFKEERIAKEVNSLFESKLLLKNQKRGLVNWAKQISGITPETKRDLISKIAGMEKVLTPESEQAFLKDLAAKRLGTEVTMEEAKKLMELSSKITELEKVTDKTKSDIPLGRAKLELATYVNELNPVKADVWTNIAGLPRSVMASLDLSAPLNQGWGMLSRKQFYTSFGTMLKVAKSESNLLDLQAQIITNPLYRDAKKAGLRMTDLGTTLEKREEAIMTTLLDKLPGIRASQRAYTGFLNKLRMDVFEDLVKKADLAGEDVGYGSKALEDIANVVNNFTGGARVGKIERGVPLLNAAFFSPRKIASTFNILNPVNYINPKISPTARKAAIRNLFGSLAVSTSIIGLGNLLLGSTPETDPTSTDFGKIRSGNSRLDLSGGNATYLTLISRVVPTLWGKGSIKNTAGQKVPLSNKIGGTSGATLVGRAVRYKFSPNLSLIMDSVTGSNAVGEPRTIPQSVMDRFKPMFINSVYELLKDDSTGTFAKSMMATGALVGGGLSTLPPPKKKKLKAF